MKYGETKGGFSCGMTGFWNLIDGVSYEMCRAMNGNYMITRRL